MKRQNEKIKQKTQKEKYTRQNITGRSLKNLSAFYYFPMTLNLGQDIQMRVTGLAKTQHGFFKFFPRTPIRMMTSGDGHVATIDSVKTSVRKRC